MPFGYGMMHFGPVGVATWVLPIVIGLFIAGLLRMRSADACATCEYPVADIDRCPECGHGVGDPPPFRGARWLRVGLAVLLLTGPIIAWHAIGWAPIVRAIGTMDTDYSLLRPMIAIAFGAITVVQTVLMTRLLSVRRASVLALHCLLPAAYLNALMASNLFLALAWW